MKVHIPLENGVDLRGCILGILAQNAGTARHQSLKILVVLSLLDSGNQPCLGCPCSVVLEVRQEDTGHEELPPQSQGSTSLQPWPACQHQTGPQTQPVLQQSRCCCGCQGRCHLAGHSG